YHPLWVLLCAPIFALARFDLVLPLRILLLVMSALQVSTAILLYRLIGKVFIPAIGAIAALYWAFSFDILGNLYMMGLESGVAAFFIVLLLYKFQLYEADPPDAQKRMKRLATLGLIGALTIFSRLDLVFFVALVGVGVVFRGRPLRDFLPLDSAAIVGSVFLSFILRLGLPEYYSYSNAALLMAALGLIAKIPLLFLLGLYQRLTLMDFRKWALRLLCATAGGSALAGVLMLAASASGDNALRFPRSVVLLDFAFTLLTLGFLRLAYTFLRAKNIALNNDEASPLLDFKQNWKIWLRDGFSYFGVAFGLLGVYMLWSKFTFDSFSPVSGQIKRWWGSFPSRVYGGATRSPLDFFGVNFQGEGVAWVPITDRLGNYVSQFSNRTVELTSYYWFVLIGASVFFFLLLLLNKDKSRTALKHWSLIPLVCGSILQTLYYHSSGYSAFKEWYWITQRVGAILLLSLALGALFTLVKNIKHMDRTAWVVAAIVGYIMGQAYWTGIHNIMRYDRWEADTPMMEIATFLETNTEPGSLIGLTGGGNVGYFIRDRAVLNMDGLINSVSYFEHLQNGTAGDYLASIGLDYVLANPYILDHHPYDGQFDKYMIPTDIFYGGKRLLIYKSDK
ncbi:MAG: hypothetical protein KJZ52_08915, partial [Anaerolineales bacterium]|nr:hypothetical protein [Anaerolineales bacterium]